MFFLTFFGGWVVWAVGSWILLTPAACNTATSLNLSRFRDGIRCRSPVTLIKAPCRADLDVLCRWARVEPPGRAHFQDHTFLQKPLNWAEPCFRPMTCCNLLDVPIRNDVRSRTQAMAAWYQLCDRPNGKIFRQQCRQPTSNRLWSRLTLQLLHASVLISRLVAMRV